MTKTHDGLRPSRTKLSAAQLVHLSQNAQAHPKALGHEMMTTTTDALRELESSAGPLAAAATAELDRRRGALASLFASSPGLAAALQSKAR